MHLISRPSISPPSNSFGKSPHIYKCLFVCLVTGIVSEPNAVFSKTQSGPSTCCLGIVSRAPHSEVQVQFLTSVQATIHHLCESLFKIYFPFECFSDLLNPGVAQVWILLLTQSCITISPTNYVGKNIALTTFYL